MTFDFDPGLESSKVALVLSELNPQIYALYRVTITETQLRAAWDAIRAYYAAKIPSGGVLLISTGVGSEFQFTPPLNIWKP